MHTGSLSFPFCYPFIDASEEGSGKWEILRVLSVQVILASPVRGGERETNVAQRSRVSTELIPVLWQTKTFPLKQ